MLVTSPLLAPITLSDISSSLHFLPHRLLHVETFLQSRGGTSQCFASSMLTYNARLGIASSEKGGHWGTWDRVLCLDISRLCLHCLVGEGLSLLFGCSVICRSWHGIDLSVAYLSRRTGLLTCIAILFVWLLTTQTGLICCLSQFLGTGESLTIGKSG